MPSTLHQRYKERIDMLVELVAGAVLAVPVVVLARRYASRDEARVYAAGLVIAAVIYVGFAVAGRAEQDWTMIELAGLVPFAAFAWLGLRRSLGWLAAGWAAHAVWDVG